jgi:hypothetical protein
VTLKAWQSFYYDTNGWALANTSRVLGGGQNGIACLRATLGADASSGYGMAPMTHLITGFCLKTSNMNPMPFLRLQSGGTILCEIWQNVGGAIEVWRGSASVLLATSVPGVLNANVEAYIEVRVKFSATIGEVEVRVNGNPTPLISITGQNTGGTSATDLYLYSKASGTRDHSAWYLIDPDTGSAPTNTFLGHIRFATLNPSANGNSSQWVGSDGNSTDNYLLVDDGSADDGDTTYVESATLNNKDTYAFGDMPVASSLIYAVCPVLHARKTDAGTRAIKPVTRRAGTDYDAAVDHYLGTTYTSYKQALIVDPSTSAAWTDSGVNAAEFGVKVSV